MGIILFRYSEVIVTLKLSLSECAIQNRQQFLKSSRLKGVTFQRKKNATIAIAVVGK